MTEYSACWETNNIEANSPFEAAKKAQRQNGFSRLWYIQNLETGEIYSVDLELPETEEEAVELIQEYKPIIQPK